MRVFIAIVCFAVAAKLEAQLPVSHGAGLVVTVDFNDDGKDEFVVVDGRQVAHIYEGFFEASRASQPLGIEELADIPVVNDRTMFVSSLDVQRRSIRVTSYDIRARMDFTPVSSTVHAAIGEPIATARTCALHRDVDNDGRKDLLLGWTEASNPNTPGASTSSTYYLLHGTTASTPPRAVRMPYLLSVQTGRPHSRSPRLVSVVHAVTPSLRNDEYLLCFSASSDEPAGGFGFTLLQDGTTQAGGIWFPRLPPLVPVAEDGRLDVPPKLEEETIAYGCFSPFPRFGVPLVKTSIGRSARLGLDPTEPFVARRGEVLHSTVQGRQLPRCIADYDDNGVQEMVWVDYVGNDPNPCLIIADPGPYRQIIRVLPLLPTAGGEPLKVHHGASGDFDGDGDQDIVLSVYQGNRYLSSGLIYIRTDRDHRHESTALLRVR